ncbi:hypothetical protein SDC9_56546 [bioreactor metagenome]|uniref:Uncharacterized protein n=1 Tax=bioreactor metagenome TaxID=1076179 RepID=A0A644X355_9ZZZZ
MLQVIFRRAPHHEGVSVAGPPGCRYRDFFSPGEVVAGDGTGRVHDVFRRAGGNHLAPVYARARADIHDVIGSEHSVFVVFYHQKGVSQVPQVLHGGKQQVVVPLMEADGGFIQNIENSHEGGADLGGQADALAFSARERTRLAA